MRYNPNIASVSSINICFQANRTKEIKDHKNYDVSFDMNQQAIKLMEDFISNAYSEYYEVGNFTSKIVSTNITDNRVEIKIMVSFEKVLKASNISELPFIQGMTASVKSLERVRSTDTPIAKYILNEQITAISEYIGEVQEENAIFRVLSNTVNDNLANPILEVYGVDEFIPAEYFIPQSPDELYAEGILDLERNVVSTKEAIAIVYPDLDVNKISESQINMLQNTRAIKYDRLAARDYANKYTSECGEGYNTTYWNKNYAWHTENEGVDCANYVSQAIFAGGIPTDSTWKPESIAWVNTGKNDSGGLAPYMTGKGYFKKVTRSTCAAGGFISHTDFSHVIFVVANDTVIMQFSSHTADRLKASFAGSYYANFNYYSINSTYQ